MLLWVKATGLALALGLLAPSARAEPFMIVGNDEKVVWDDEGKLVVSPAGRDNVVIVDLANPEDPKIVGHPAAQELHCRSACERRY